MKHIYSVGGDSLNDRLFAGMLWTSALGSIQCESDLSIPHTLRWAEEVSGGTDTPFMDVDALYNGTPCQSDFRVITYEDGSPMIDAGKVYFSMTTQIGYGTGGMIICAYDLDTNRIEMTGCVRAQYNNTAFTASGNAVVYNREDGLWYLLTHSPNSLGHILLIANSASDPRFGVSNVVFSALDYQNPGAGDEDQFIFYSAELQKWVMLYVAIRNSGANYILRMHTSDYVDHGYTFYKEVDDSSVLRATGVTSTIIGGVRYVISGSSATGANKYLAYSFPDLEYVCELSLDFGTNANLGTWAALFPVPKATHSEYYLFTFDRAILIPGNVYSYGCMYMYRAEETNNGLEFPILRDGITINIPVTPTYSLSQLHFARRFAQREAMSMPLSLSGIKLEQAVLFDYSNMYPVLSGSSGLTQSTDGLFLDTDGSAAILGGEHEPYSAYILPVSGISGTDRRAIVLLDKTNAMQMRIAVDRDRKVYGYNGATETLLGTMRENSGKLVVTTSQTAVRVWEI